MKSALCGRLRGHFAACAAGAVVVMGGASTASAQIVWSGIVNLNVPSTFDGVYLNVVTGQTASGSFAGYDVNPYGTTSLLWFSPASTTTGGFARGAGSSATLVDNLAFGSIIDATLSYGNGGSETTGVTAFNLNSSENLVGFRFLNEDTGAVHFGWLRIELGANGGVQPRNIVEWAYESQAGVGIAAGVIPAPGAIALLGLAGLAGSRRRRA
jgi:hypothetical protein